MSSLLSKTIEDLDCVNLAQSINLDTNKMKINSSMRYTIKNETLYEEEILRIGVEIQNEKQKLYLMMEKLSFIDNFIQSNLKK